MSDQQEPRNTREVAVKKLKVVLRWTWRILLLLLAILIVSLVVFIFKENTRGRTMLARYNAVLRAKGEKLTLEEMNIVLPRKESTSDAELGAAARELSVIRKESQFDVWAATRLRWFGPGRVIVRCRETDLDVPWHWPPGKKGESPSLPTNAVTQTGRGKTDGTYMVWVADWDDLGKRLSVASNALARVRAALTNGEVLFPDNSEGSKSPLLGYQEVEGVRAWLAAAGLNEIHDGKLDSTIRDISLIATLARVRRDERLMQGGYRRIGIGEKGLDLTWEALQAPGWNDSRLSRLQAAWKMDSILPNIISALEVERGFDIAFYNRVRGSVGEWQRIRRSMLSEAQCGCSGKDWLYDIEVSLHFALWRAAWLDQSEEALLRKYQSQLEAARDVVAGRPWNNVYHPPVGVDRARYGYLNGGFSWYERVLRVAMQFETRRQMTLTAIALKRFEIRHDHLPDNLSELVPEFLAELPRDYMTDQPLRYRLKVDGNFILYSVGNDGRDDGGNPMSRPSGSVNVFAIQLWEGADAVWPTAATPEEIKAQELKWAAPGEGRRRGPARGQK